MPAPAATPAATPAAEPPRPPQQQQTRPPVASQLLARVRGQGGAAAAAATAGLRPEHAKLVRAPLAELREALPRCRLMARKAALVEERLAALDADLEELLAPEGASANALQLESVMHALLESMRNVVGHESPEKLIVAFFLLGSERTNMNMHLQSLALAAGTPFAGGPLEEFMKEVAAADEIDLDADSVLFREALAKLQQAGEIDDAEDTDDAFANGGHVSAEGDVAGESDHENRRGTEGEGAVGNEDFDPREGSTAGGGQVIDELLARDRRIGELAATLEAQLGESDRPRALSLFESQRRDASGSLPRRSYHQATAIIPEDVLLTVPDGGAGTTEGGAGADSGAAAANAEDAAEPTAFPALDIRRPNIYRISSLLAQLVKEMNAILDAEVSLDMPLVPEAEISGSQKVRLGSKVCVTEHKRNGDKVLSFRPFSQVNRSGTGAVMYDSLSARSRAEIRRELALWSRLENKNVLHLEGGIFALNSMAVVMDPADLTLFDFLYKEGRSPQGKELETMMRGLARGLAHLHKHNIVHRQLSPHNILLSYERGLRIAGFGFGWVEASVRESVQVQYAYMAPELLRTGVSSTRRLSFSSDVYAAGMLLYEMSHHKRPFAGASYNEVLSLVGDQHVQPTCEHEILASVGYWFPATLAQCWDADAAKRPSAASLFGVVRNNTRASVRSSGRVMQAMLSFLPRRNAGSPRPALEVLSRAETEPKEVHQALSQLLELAVKQARSGRQRHDAAPTRRVPQSKMMRVIARSSRRLTNAGVTSTGASLESEWQNLVDDEDEHEDDDDGSAQRAIPGTTSATGPSSASTTTGNGEWFFSRLWDLEGGRTVVDQLVRHGEDASIALLCLRLLRIIGRSQFEPYFSDRLHALVQMSAVEHIVNTMNMHEEDVGVLVEGAGALRSLASAGNDVLLNDVRRARMIESEALDTVLRAMEAHPGAVALQLNGVGLVRNVSFSEDAINSSAMETAVTLVVRACSAHETPALTRRAIAALSNLSFAPRNQERMLDDPQAVEELVGAVQANGSDARLLAAAFLTMWNLLFADGSLSLQLQSLGVFELARAALQNFPQDTHLVSNTLSLIDSMAWVLEVREALVDEGMIEVVEDALRFEPDAQEVWEAGVSALKSLSWSSTAPLEDTGTTEFVFDKVTSTYLLNVDILRSALLLLQNLTCIEDNLGPLAKCGAADWVLRAMGAHPKDSIMAEAGSGALCNLATPDENKEIVFKSGVVTVLQRTLRIHADSELISRNAACAIVRLARLPEIYEAIDRDALAGPLKGVSYRYPELAEFPDLQDLDELFPVDSALLDRCSICLEELFVDQTSMPYECEHCFHLHCVGKWTTVTNTCPLCRSPLSETFVMPDDISEVDPRYEEDEALLAPFLEEGNNRGSNNGGASVGSAPRAVLNVPRRRRSDVAGTPTQRDSSPSSPQAAVETASMVAALSTAAASEETVETDQDDDEDEDVVVEDDQDEDDEDADEEEEDDYDDLRGDEATSSGGLSASLSAIAAASSRAMDGDTVADRDEEDDDSVAGL